jgi:cobalt-precorrin-5B (C1)-methyltransferase
MDSMRMVGGKMLRCGYTTGSCAAAAAKASAIMLLTQEACHSVTLKTPKGIILTLNILEAEYTAKQASCAVQKDSGDDPDVTNGVLVYAEVSRIESGIKIQGGKGIGRVTKPGLNQPAGEYAINSAPRQMIAGECENICREAGYTGGLSVVISIPNGEELALKTFNPRMGIENGLSILGTTGIVEPMSDTAVVDTIRAELSLLYESGRRGVLLTVGNYGEEFARDTLKLSLEAHIKCSNFIGETLSAAAEKGFSRALLIGHIGKLVKLGIGITNTHSSRGDGRMETLIACALEAGAGLQTLHEIRKCVSADAALDCLRGELMLMEKTMILLCGRVEDTLQRHAAAHLEIGFICFGGTGDKTELCFQNGTAKKLREVFAS